MTQNPTLRPSYDDWLYHCMQFVKATRLNSHTDRTALNLGSDRLEAQLGSCVKPLIERRIIDQEFNERAPSSLDSDSIEEHINEIKAYIEIHRDALDSMAKGDNTLLAGPARDLIDRFVRDEVNSAQPRMTDVRTFHGMLAYADTILAARAWQRQQKTGIVS